MSSMTYMGWGSDSPWAKKCRHFFNPVTQSLDYLWSLWSPSGLDCEQWWSPMTTSVLLKITNLIVVNRGLLWSKRNINNIVFWEHFSNETGLISNKNPFHTKTWSIYVQGVQKSLWRRHCVIKIEFEGTMYCNLFSSVWFRLRIHRHPYMERLLPGPTVEVTYLQFSTSPASESSKFWTDFWPQLQ